MRARKKSSPASTSTQAALDRENVTDLRSANLPPAEKLRRYPWGDEPRHDQAPGLRWLPAGARLLDERRRFAIVSDEAVGRYTITVCDGPGSWVELADVNDVEACGWADAWARDGHEIYHVSPLGVPVILYTGGPLLAADCVHVIQEQAGRWTVYRYRPKTLPEALLYEGSFATALNIAAKLVPKGVRLFVMPKGRAW